MEPNNQPISILDVKRNSPADQAGIKPGDKLLTINCEHPSDILRYEILTAVDRVTLEISPHQNTGKIITITIDKDVYEPLGLVFSTSVFDGVKTCANKCVFCFIDQLPEGMRKAVYVKDDDYRLSFLYGNFVTLTNMNEKDIERIIADRLSPLYLSLHAVDPELRCKMLGRKKDDLSLRYLKRLSDAGIELHIQIVLCPDLNTGEALEKSLDILSRDYEGVASVGLVPVGLTGYREKLYPLRAFEKKEIMELISKAAEWQADFKKEKGCPWVYLADEFYIIANTEIPSDEKYCGYPQIENGIGLTRLFIDGFHEAIEQYEVQKLSENTRIALVTGELFAPILRSLSKELENKIGLHLDIIAVENRFFGGCVDVTGLLTGEDIIEAVKQQKNQHPSPDLVVIPDVILNADGLMLDGNTPESVEKELSIKIMISPSDADGFITKLIEKIRV